MFLQNFFQLIDAAPEDVIGFALCGDGFLGVKHIGMSPAESRADLVAGQTGHFAAQIHGNHAGLRDLPGPAGTDDIGNRNTEVAGDHLLNGFRTDITGSIFFSKLGMKQLFGIGDGKIIASAHFQSGG